MRATKVVAHIIAGFCVLAAIQQTHLAGIQDYVTHQIWFGIMGLMYLLGAIFVELVNLGIAERK